MKKVKISANDMKNLIKEQGKKITEIKYKVEDKEIIITVNPAIAFDERMRMIKSVIEMAVGDITKIEEYNPAVKEFAFRYEVINTFTNLELPDDLNATWLLLTQTNIFNDICSEIYNDFCELKKEINEGIKYRLDSLANKSDTNAVIEKLSSGINNLGDKINPGDITKLIDTMKSMPNLDGESIVKAVIANSEKGSKTNKNK